MNKYAYDAPQSADKCIGACAEGWLSEVSAMWPGQCMSLQIDEELFRGRSDFQDVYVFRNASYGNVLVLDGVIQATERDEFAYQEMITHLALCSLNHEPKRVLVVGGGDGGVLREITRHAGVERIEIAELDAMVIEMSKKFLPTMALGFADERVTVHVTDGIKYVENAEEGTYDAIIVDSSDPIGPASVLFEEAFFKKMYRALKPGGVVCTQAECVWLHIDLISELARMCAGIFKGGSIDYGYTTIPTYPSGQIGFMLCSKPANDGSTVDFRTPKRFPVAAENSPLPPLRYYNEEVHPAAFVLPEFARAALAPHLVPGTK
jgi:spermidine synthase